MKQIALVIAAMAALSLPASAQHAPGPQMQARPPMMHQPPAMRPPPGVRPPPGMRNPQATHRPPGWRPRHGWPEGPGGIGAGPSVFMTPSSAPSAEIVTREFIDPREPAPRAPIAVVRQKPVAYWQPPHIIQVKRFKPRRPIAVVRRGLISLE